MERVLQVARSKAALEAAFVRRAGARTTDYARRKISAVRSSAERLVGDAGSCRWHVVRSGGLVVLNPLPRMIAGSAVVQTFGPSTMEQDCIANALDSLAPRAGRV